MMKEARIRARGVSTISVRSEQTEGAPRASKPAGKDAGSGSAGRLARSHERHLPSVWALVANDDVLLEEELGLVELRRQVAVVRTMADALQRCLVRCEREESARSQLAEEMARLERLMVRGTTAAND